MDVDWSEFESLLLDIASRDIRDFAAAHSDEVFYGFAFDCNSEYGQVLLCLNTEADLQRQAEAYKSDHPKLYGGQAIDEIRSHLRWNMGDWKYKGFNSPAFNRAWHPVERNVLEICIEEDEEDEDDETFLTPTQDRFMRSVCRVLLRLEKARALDRLNQTEEFVI